MPAPNRPTPRKSSKFLDTKTLIATLSLAVTLGLWNVFSVNALRAGQPTADPAVAPPPDQPGLPPLPTLVPVLDVSAALSGSDAAPAVTAGSNPAALAEASLPLRSVSAGAGTTIVQKFKPVIASFDSAGSSGGGGSRAVTRTRSSRK